jgi:hypothetical protein
MYIISAVICFIAVGTLQIDLCFKSEVPLEFKSMENKITVSIWISESFYSQFRHLWDL